MPLYTYQCGRCGRETDEFRTVAERHDAPKCHGRMRLCIMPTQIQAEIQGYVSPASGNWIDSRAARRADLRATNSRPWEGIESEKREAARRKKEAEAKFDRKIEDTARKLYHQLPADQRRALESPT